ncbi:MAG: hypothetical protein LBH03_06295 [Holophagales bacterium]|nr:hypothetical protein [Holophagales bacterium]
MFIKPCFLLLHTVSLLAQQNSAPARWEIGIGNGFALAPVGLLGDMTNIMPSINLKTATVFNVNANNALMVNCHGHYWFDSHHFRGTDGHRAKVHNNSYALGFRRTFGNSRHINHEFSDFRCYLSVEAGITKWEIDSSTHAPLNGSRYTKPIGAVYLGMKEMRPRGFYFEVGLELNFLDTSKIEFKKYSTPDIALVAGYGTFFGFGKSR